MSRIRLFQEKLEQIKEKDKLYTSLVVYMDRMGQLEVRILQENQKSA